MLDLELALRNCVIDYLVLNIWFLWTNENIVNIQWDHKQNAEEIKNMKVYSGVYIIDFLMVLLVWMHNTLYFSLWS